MLTQVMPGAAIKGEVIDFTMMECGGCGIPYYVPTRWYKSKINEHGSFNCPNGCSRHFVAKTEAEKLKEELDKIKAQKNQSMEDLQNQLLDEMNRANKLDKQLKRVHKGVCPCCNRSFTNLQRHMQTKHPEVAPKNVVDPIHGKINAKNPC